MLNTHQRQNWHFIKHFLRNPLQVGAIAPSSQRLANEMLSGLSLENGDVVLELGPGTGAFTVAIREILPDNNHYMGIECEPKFVTLLRNNFPELQFVNGRAENAKEFCENQELPQIKFIISGIPFANIWKDNAQNSIIDTLDGLMDKECMFRTFQYVHAYRLPPAVRFRKAMNDRFGKVSRSKIVLKNLPPAYVLTWKRK